MTLAIFNPFAIFKLIYDDFYCKYSNTAGTHLWLLHGYRYGHRSTNHGGKEGQVPPEFLVKDANANCAPDFVMFQNFKHNIACITMQGNGNDKNDHSEFTKTPFQAKITIYRLHAPHSPHLTKSFGSTSPTPEFHQVYGCGFRNTNIFIATGFQ